MLRSIKIFGLAGWLSVVFMLSAVFAAPTPAQKEQLSQLSAAIAKAGTLYKNSKFKESADVLKEVQTKLDKLSEKANKDLINALSPLYDKLERAHAALELEGIELPAIKRPMEMPADAPAADAAPGAKGVPTGAVSFVKDVAPILVSKCGSCHVRGAKGMISMSSYTNLMKGKTGVEMVIPKQADASFLVGVIEDARMPPSGIRLPANEIATIKKWINEGGKFDGKDAEENLNTLAPGTKEDTGPKVELAIATGKEKISFATDIAPMLLDSCFSCHGGGRRAEENFNLTSFDGLLRGGNTGAVIVPGKPAESLIVKKLKGTGSGKQMPTRGDKWKEDEIAKMELWIKEGAKFDGISSKADIERVINVAKAQRSTHEQLTADRAKLCEQHWRLGSPGIKASKVESKNFLAMGDVGENTLKDIGERADALAPKVAAILKADPDAPLIKGRFTLFVFGERYGYSEFGKMVEKRDIPKEWRGHWTYDIVDAYGTMVPSRSHDYSLEALIAQSLAGTYVASLGKIPHWFAEGSGRVVAAKIDGSDSRVRHWNDNLSAAVSDMKKPEEFMSSAAASEYSDVCSYSFVTYLMSDLKRYHSLLDDLRNGTDFDKAFTSRYGGSPAQAAALWVKNPPTVKGGSKPIAKSKK